jgi:transcriptional regulator with XRE-family HTH domain
MNQTQSGPFAARLKELREAAGMTQQQLAEQAGMHKLSVAKLEQGIREPGWATVQMLANALGGSTEAFRTPPAEREPQGRGRPVKAKEEDAEPASKRPRGRPRKDGEQAAAKKATKGKTK